MFVFNSLLVFGIHLFYSLWQGISEGRGSAVWLVAPTAGLQLPTDFCHQRSPAQPHRQRRPKPPQRQRCAAQPQHPGELAARPSALPSRYGTNQCTLVLVCSPSPGLETFGCFQHHVGRTQSSKGASEVSGDWPKMWGGRGQRRKLGGKVCHKRQWERPMETLASFF